MKSNGSRCTRDCGWCKEGYILTHVAQTCDPITLAGYIRHAHKFAGISKSAVWSVRVHERSTKSAVKAKAKN